jgi:hypothetical protein
VLLLLNKSYKSFRKHIDFTKYSPYYLNILKLITIIIKMIFYYLIPVSKRYNSLFFNRKEITTFLKSLN